MHAFLASARRALSPGTLAPFAARLRRQPFALAVIASIGLHILAALVVFLLPDRGRIVAPQERVVSVEILSPGAFRALQPERAPSAAPDTAAPQTPAEPGAGGGAEAGMTRATRLRAAALLAEPGSRQVREALPQLADDERMIQLCDIEAIEQIRHGPGGFLPETMVAYALAEPRRIGWRLEADGAAFRSRRQWYGLRFRCEVAADFSRVVDFAFRVEKRIPRNTWSARGLTATDGPAD